MSSQLASPLSVVLRIDAKLWPKKGPLRLRMAMATAETEDGRKINLSVCLSGSAIYVMIGDSQIAIDAESIAKACLHTFDLQD